jgi:hypothetical protein
MMWINAVCGVSIVGHVYSQATSKHNGTRKHTSAVQTRHLLPSPRLRKKLAVLVYSSWEATASDIERPSRRARNVVLYHSADL